MTNSEIRQSFLDFFKSKSHTIVPSSSLMPDSPGLLFTNAGMNQFVPIFLNQKKPDVSKWAGAVPAMNTRAADTQKCIRAGGKHNDLEDVGLDTYHHTFFEMLGNWSFGDYFKKEAIEWAWELVVKAWEFPPNRLYATVFCPYLGEPGWEAKWQTELEQVLVLAMTSPDFISPNPKASPFEVADQEAAMYWAKKFQTAGLDPKVHIIPGNKKDNFWMMGDTGPCGPCSEMHFDLTPKGDTKGALVNKGDARCIEIWNLVFIQFNANPDGTYSPLPAKHVDTGMGFERVTSIIQGTKGFTDFETAKISNYETDIFRPIFAALEKLSGKEYRSTLPDHVRGEDFGTVVGKVIGTFDPQQVQIDIGFRVIADHLRTLSFAIADGIQPGNTDRNYVLRRILRRAVRYGHTLGFHEPFFYKLVDVLADTMGDVFPEIRAKKKHVQEVIRVEEEAFNKTLDTGMEIFERVIKYGGRLRKQAALICDFFDKQKYTSLKDEGFAKQLQVFGFEINKLMTWKMFFVATPRFWDRLFSASEFALIGFGTKIVNDNCDEFGQFDAKKVPRPLRANLDSVAAHLRENAKRLVSEKNQFSANAAFLLYDTYGFPLDLTEQMAREQGMTVDVQGFNLLMEEQRTRARAAQKKEIISVSQIETTKPTTFVGYDDLDVKTHICEVAGVKEKIVVVLDRSSCYAEMGGQVGDTGQLIIGSSRWRVFNTQKHGVVWLHYVEGDDFELNVAWRGEYEVIISVDRDRRNAIQRHHTVTHLLHWALHEVVSKDASQKGSFVGPDKLTFDFNSAPLKPQQVADVEKLVNERILENAGVSWTEVPYADIKSRKDVMQFFGEKYGDVVRVVQIGGHPGKLDGYDMELCGGTHTRATGEIGLFRIVGESAIAAGVRRIEAIAGLEAYRKATDEVTLIKSIAGKVNSPIHELEKKVENLLAQQKKLEKEVQIALQRNASNAASELLERAHTVNGIPLITHNLGDADPDFLQATADALKGRFKGVVVLGGCGNNAVTLVATVSPEFTAKVQAGKIIQQIAPIVGGKGGGRPDNARGGGKDASKLNEALSKAKSLLG